ncbi:MAG: DNA-binding protein [Acinetobacter sp.]
MQAAYSYIAVIESDKPLDLRIGQAVSGGQIKELKIADVELVSASQLAAKYNLSTDTIRARLASINQGTTGKALYNPRRAHELLTQKESKKGRPRVN